MKSKFSGIGKNHNLVDTLRLIHPTHFLLSKKIYVSNKQSPETHKIIHE